MKRVSLRLALKPLAMAALLLAGVAHGQDRSVRISHAPDSDAWWNTIKNSVKHAGEDHGLAVAYRNPPNGDLADTLLNRGQSMGTYAKAKITKDALLDKMAGGAEMQELMSDLDGVTL